MIKTKLKKISERNAFEQFLFNNVNEICEKEVLDANEVSHVTGININKLREWSRCSRYSTYIRGTPKNKPLIMIETEALRHASAALIIQEAEEEKEAALAAHTRSYIKNVVAGDISAALLLLQGSLKVQGTTDNLRDLLVKACAIVELAYLEAAKDK